MSGGKAAAGQVAAATIYTGGRIATNALTIGQAFVTAAAQIGAMKWMVDRQQSMWDHVATKQIHTVEVAVDEFVKGVDNLLPTFTAAYPEVPVPARFVEVNPVTVQFQQMVDNITNAPKAAEYMTAANYWHRVNYAARVEFLSPGFAQQLVAHLRQVETLMAGRIPPDELIYLTTNDAENAAANGRLGNTRLITAASLGVRKLQLQAAGRNELFRHAELLDKISPVSSEVTLDDLMIKPQNRLALALEQAQLLQNDLQNANNAAAQKHPAKMAELQTKLQRVVAVLSFNANKANMQNQFVPNFPGIFGPSISNLTKAITGAFQHERSPASGPDLGGHLTPSGGTTT